MTNMFVVSGHLARDPHPFKGGAYLTVAENRGTDQVSYHNVTSFGRLAEAQVDHLTKGRPVSITGHIETGRFDDAEGNTHDRVSLIADQITWLGRRSPDGPSAA